MAKSKKIILNLNSFAVRLRQLIDENSTSQQKVAESIGVTRQALNNWVNGESVPDALVAAKIAKHFDVTVDYLIGNSPIKSANADIRAVFNKLGITENALDRLRELYNKDDEYGDLSDFINEFLSTLDKDFFYFIAEHVKYKHKREIFRHELFKKFLKDNGVDATDEDAELILKQDYYYMRKSINRAYYDYFDRVYFDTMLMAYKPIDTDLKTEHEDENADNDIANELKNITERTISNYFGNNYYDKPLSEEEQKKLHEYYAKAVNTEPRSKEFNDIVLKSFYKDFDYFKEFEGIKHPELERLLKIVSNRKEDEI